MTLAQCGVGAGSRDCSVAADRGAAERSDDLCIEPLGPIGLSRLPGFSTGYLIGFAAIAGILAVEPIVVILLR